MRKAFGGAFCAMNSKELGADIVFAWPIAQIAVVGAEGAVNIVYRKEIMQADDPEQVRKRHIEDYEKKFLNLNNQISRKSETLQKRPNLRIIGIDEREEIQVKGTENIFNKIIEVYFSNLKKGTYKNTRSIQNIK